MIGTGGDVQDPNARAVRTGWEEVVGSRRGDVEDVGLAGWGHEGLLGE